MGLLFVPDERCWLTRHDQSQQNSAFLKEINNERWGDAQVGGSEDYLKEHHDESGDQSPRNQVSNHVRITQQASNLLMRGSADYPRELHQSQQLRNDGVQVCHGLLLA